MNNIKFTDGGVTAPVGFKANGIHCGIRKNKNNPDLALIYCETVGNTAAVYTQNLVKGAPIAVTKANISDGKAQAVICNSGIANTCNADGVEKAEKTCKIAAQALSISEKDIIVASTGVIGQPLPIEPIANSIDALVKGLNKDGSNEAAHAIMTTDTHKKEYAVQFEICGKTCTIGGIAKGSGMIHPNMATMLCFLTTDAAVSSDMLGCALHEVITDSFNMISIDGDTSTNDMVSIIASGKAGNNEIASKDNDYKIFTEALKTLCITISREIARDGEGASKLIVCEVSGAQTKEKAVKLSKSVICSSLVKAAMFGADANWGRVLCALGYAGADIDVGKVDVAFSSPAGYLPVCKSGAGIPFSEELAKKILTENEVTIEVKLYEGEKSATAFGCDLTYDYVKINGDYRT